MEIVTIEKKTFELWQEKFNHIYQSYGCPMYSFAEKTG